MDYLMQMRILIQDERQEFEHDLESSGQRYLEYVRTLADKHDVSQVETELLRGSLHQIILRRARELGVDAIVVGGWKQTITRKDTTSVERQLILSEADCPVVTVKTGARDRSRVETSPRRP
jgi:nucleotide-binding universal stress UspA family protein